MEIRAPSAAQTILLSGSSARRAAGSPAYAALIPFPHSLGNRNLLRHERDAIGELSELVLVRTNNFQIPRLVEGLGDRWAAQKVAVPKYGEKLPI
jgi:hypothetical protein